MSAKIISGQSPEMSELFTQLGAEFRQYLFLQSVDRHAFLHIDIRTLSSTANSRIDSLKHKVPDNLPRADTSKG